MYGSTISHGKLNVKLHALDSKKQSMTGTASLTEPLSESANGISELANQLRNTLPLRSEWDMEKRAFRKLSTSWWREFGP
jgi:hypothetical protein